MPENAGKLSQFLTTVGTNNFAGADGKSAVAAGDWMGLAQRSSTGKAVPFAQWIGRATIVTGDTRQPAR